MHMRENWLPDLYKTFCFMYNVNIINFSSHLPNLWRETEIQSINQSAINLLANCAQ